MNKSFKLMALAVFIALFFISAPMPTAAALIEPTRTLMGSAEQMGKLSVFSEPPSIEVILDGNKIGKTPIIEREIVSGTHVLTIKDKETKILVEPGKSRQYSWFKGTLIEIPFKEKQTNQPSEKEMIGEAGKTQQPKENKENFDPYYWPMNPRGPIY